MSVRIPIINVAPMPPPEFTPRSRREESTRDTANRRNIEAWQGGPAVLQPFYRPQPSLPTYEARKTKPFYDQAGIPSRNQQPVSVPAPSFNPAGAKLEGNPYFDQYAPSFDPRNVARELRASVVEGKMDRGIAESQRILARGFSSRYVPEGYAQQQQFDSLQAYESLKPKIDDVSRSYRKYD
jgi:hypothetical protein